MIPYTYEVIEASDKGLVLLYKSPGKPDIQVGTHAPKVGESLDAIASMYAPVQNWIDMETPVYVPAVGTRGSFTPPSFTGPQLSELDQAKADKLKAIADWRYYQENKGIPFEGKLVKTDRASRHALADVYTSLKNNLVDKADWKIDSSNWITLDLPKAELLLTLVDNHVQTAFSTERVLSEQVALAASLEQVNAIQIPDEIIVGMV